MDAIDNTNGHVPEPIKDSWYTIYGMPAELNKPWDYPVEAVCIHCGKSIKSETYMAMWEHFERVTE